MSSRIEMERALLGQSAAELEVLRALLERAPTGAIVYRPIDGGDDFLFVYTNPALEAMKPLTKMLGKTYRETWPEIADIAVPRLRLVLQTGEPWKEHDLPLEVEIAPGEVATHYYTHNVSRVRVEGEDFLIGSVTDVTNEMEVRAALTLSLASERERINRLQVLREVDEITTSSLELSDVINGALLAAEKHFGVLAASVWTLDAGGRRLSLVGARGFPPAFSEDYGEGLDLAEPYPVVRTVREASPLFFEHIGEGVHAPVRDAYGRYGVALASLAAIPLISQGTVIGGMTLAWKESRHFDDEEVAFITTLAGRFSDAIENARLFRERAEQAEYAEALNRINSILHATLDPDEIMQRIVDEMADALGVDASLMVLKRNGCWELAHARGLPHDVELARLRAEDSPLSVLIEQAGDLLAIADVSAHEEAAGSVMARYGARSLVGLPLLMRGSVVAVLYAGWFRKRPDFSPRELDFARKVAATVSLALENASLYETQLSFADRLQEALLAVPEAIAGIDFSHAYRSATEAARVGGDFYDVFDMSDERVGIVIGDVAGKGLDAAVLTSLVKHTIHAHSADRGKSPAQVLALTSDVVYAETRPESFITGFLAFLNRRDGSLVFGNAGHTTGILLKPDRSIVPLAPTGPILGAFEHVEYEEGSVWLDPDDVLLLYTDGLIEARRNNSFYGQERLFDLLREVGVQAPGVMVERVTEDLLAFTGGALSDDVAILALCRLDRADGAAAPRKVEL